MKLIETVHSRHGTPRFIYEMGENWYRIVGESYYMRWGGQPDKIEFADFEGGPFIVVGGDYISPTKETISIVQVAVPGQQSVTIDIRTKDIP